MLLAKRADVDIRNNQGETALKVATRRGNAEVVRLLRTHGS